MSEPVSLGQFEQLVLTAILSLGENAYGVTIHAQVEELARPKKASLGAVYATLDRLEDKELITSWLSGPTPERALHDAAVAAKRICEVVERSWGGIWSPVAKKWKPARQS